MVALRALKSIDMAMSEGDSSSPASIYLLPVQPLYGRTNPSYLHLESATQDGSHHRPIKALGDLTETIYTKREFRSLLRRQGKQTMLVRVKVSLRQMCMPTKAPLIQQIVFWPSLVPVIV